jgi:photosystem II stability/assembly factor-like uncharacterized protein
VDGGSHWQIVSPPDAQSLDFRALWAWDADHAVLLSIGPGEASCILRTQDGGAHWQTMFRNPDRTAFYDGIAFWDRKYGIALSDPVDGKFRILRTEDGGATWAVTDPAGMPPALKDEGAFAASNTCLVVRGKAKAWFASGGSAARVFHTEDGGKTWSVSATPVVHGTALAGISSLCFPDDRHGAALGGDYEKPGEAAHVAATTSDGGVTWSAVETAGPGGYRSGSAMGRHHTVIAVGLNGSSYSRDGGLTWTEIGPDPFHAVSISPDGTGWAVGEHGRVAKLSRL